MKQKKEVTLFLDSGAHSLYMKLMLQNNTFNESEYDKYFKNYIEFIKENEEVIDVYVNLDVINDPVRSMKNYKYMVKQGLKPIGVVHPGEDHKWIDQYIDMGCEYIGLGGLGQFFTKQKYYQWADPAWSDHICDRDGMPKVKVHGFAMTSLDLMWRYPWYCMTERDHSVLTKSGWKELPDLKVGEEILAFNEGKMEWQKIQEIPIFEIKNQEIDHLYNRNFDAFVSSNHRWKVSLDREPDKNYYWKTTETLERKDCINRVGNDYSFIKKKVLTDEQVGLLAWYWTDGSIRKRPQYNEDDVVIYQSERANSEKCKIIRDLLIKSKEKFCEMKSKRDELITFELYGKISKWLLSFAPEKKLPVELPLLLTKEQAEMFIKYSILADGGKTGLKRTEGFAISVKRQQKKENLEVLRIISLLLGVPTSVYFGKSKIYKALRSSSVFHVYVSALKKEKIKYTGRLWCVRVTSGAFFTKCNDKIYVTGNSVDSTSWVQTGRFGGVYVPKFRRGQYVYNENSLKVTISNQSPSQKDDGQHFTTFSPMEQKQILKYFDEKGFAVGRSEYRKEDRKKYKLKDGERWVNSIDAEACRDLIENLGKYVPPDKLAMKDLVETIIEPGLSNDYRLRDELNIIYFLDLQNAMPKWPWPFKVKSNKGFDL